LAILRKFRAWRPKVGLEKNVASYPYDVLSSEEARDLAQDNPYSFLHVVKPEIDLPAEIDLYSQPVYNKAKENLQKFIQEGILIQDKDPMLYIYRQTMFGREQYGIVGCVSVEDYDSDVIKKHEHTRPAKERDRIKHVEITNANTGPIFLTYKAKETINNLVAEAITGTPVYDFTASDGIGHTVWVIEDDDISEKIIREFNETDFLYVADGHHRSASAARVANKKRQANPGHTGNEEYNFFLAVLFPDVQLQILDYNRVVKHLNTHTEEELLHTLEKTFSIEKMGAEPYKPQKKGEIGMYLDNKWCRLTVRPEIAFANRNDPVKSLDISVLQDNVLGVFFGIDDPRTSDDIDFIGGIRGLEELVRLVDSEKFKVAFAMYPVSIQELMNIADAGKVMPPKSTWFEPKLRSGLLIHTLED
jgi:uncharacterized protein (DUF1015 family)